MELEKQSLNFIFGIFYHFQSHQFVHVTWLTFSVTSLTSLWHFYTISKWYFARKHSLKRFWAFLSCDCSGRIKFSIFRSAKFQVDLRYTSVSLPKLWNVTNQIPRHINSKAVRIVSCGSQDFSTTHDKNSSNTIAYWSGPELAAFPLLKNAPIHGRDAFSMPHFPRDNIWNPFLLTE